MNRFLNAFVAGVLLAFSSLAAQATDANRATQAELEAVKGIGPGLSAKILKARETGTFKDWSDLVDRVGGVGPGNAARFSQAGLTVGGQAYDGRSSAAKPARAGKAEGSEKADKAAKAEKASKANPA